MKSDKMSNLLGLYLLAALAGAGLVGFFVIKPLLNSGRTASAKLAATKQQIVALHQLDNDTQTLRQNYNNVKSQRDAILLQLPVQSEEEHLLAQLSAFASASGVVLSSFSPSGQTPTGSQLTSVSIYPVSVNVSGTYQQIQQFLSRVENGARFIDVQSASESGSPDPKTKAVVVTDALGLNAYYQGSGSASSNTVAVNGGTQ